MMQVDGMISESLERTGDDARQLETEGFRAAWAGETKHDVFLRCATAAAATSSIDIGSAVAIAFGRSPLTVASCGYDLSCVSRGRFRLGLGSQVKAHIERRFSMPWSRPADRMREYIQAVRAIWHSWQYSTTVDFRGEFYQHTLMPEFFRPPPHAYGPPPVYMAAVGERMTEVAGEVCQGLLFHPFTTAQYLRGVTLPALARGRARSELDLGPAQVRGPVLVAAGRTGTEVDAAVEGVRRQIAFYASTPAYRPVLEFHGWADHAPRLLEMSRLGRWDEMAAIVTDEMLSAFAVVGSPRQVAAELRTRFSDLATAVSFSAPYRHDRALWPEIIAELARVSDDSPCGADRSPQGSPSSEMQAGR